MRVIGWGMVLIFAAFLSGFAQEAEEEEKGDPAEIKVRGYGLFGNIELKATLKLLLGTEEMPEFLQSSFIEDAVLVLFARLERDGYLNPSIRVTLTTEDGQTRTYTWLEPLQAPIPRDLRVSKARFEIEEGILFYYDFIGFRGLDAIPAEEALTYFIEGDALIPLRRNRIFSPDRLTSSVENLSAALRRQGFQSASVYATNLVVRTNTGAVSVDIVAEEGPRSIVRGIQEVFYPPGSNGAPATNLISTNIVYSRMWQQDYEQRLLREQYEQGFADASVNVSQIQREPAGTNIFLRMRAEIRPGQKIRIGEIQFKGLEHTREAMLRRKVQLEEGEPLNPIQAQEGRYRLARLGIFDSVELDYAPADPNTRNVIYELDEGKRIDINLLLGYGSYELLRGGFEIEQYNLWGLAHNARLRAIQSLKSTRGDYTYAMPEVLGRDFDAFASASYLRREEISFTREEFGGGAGVRRSFPSIFTDVSLRYQYQVLNAADFDFSAVDGLREANVGAFILDVRHDRRDNPLTPRGGWKIFTDIEFASETLLGDVNYQRFESAASYHRPLLRTLWLHLGLAHGFIRTASGPDQDLPFNKRFFPGGDSSIRGYQYGEAAPRDEEGRLVGAETYLLGNIELEQALTRTWSIVGFIDGLGIARRLDDYPFDETLFSVGGGIRWRTIIGPIRLEYGHNLNPREEDPAGTLHFSVGFPF